MTPIRHQYLRIKQGYPEAIVLFRLGDFYETFDEDARLASRELDIVLTSRSMGKGLKMPMAGIPAHSLDPYLARLIKKGHTVAICEQLSDPNASKGLVERDVVRLVTPGTVLEPSLLDQGANNYLAAVVADGVEAGLAYVDISTGEFAVTQLPEAEVPLELGPTLPRRSPCPPGRGIGLKRTLSPKIRGPEIASQRRSLHRPLATTTPDRPSWIISGHSPWSPSAAPAFPWRLERRAPLLNTWAVPGEARWMSWPTSTPTPPAVL